MSYTIRRAVEADQPVITAIVRHAGINPFSLHWPRFLVAEDGGQVIGVVQIKLHGDGSRELASLAVIPERQGQHIGSALVSAILAGEHGPLYLMCRDPLEGYYARFGFRRADFALMPQYFRRMMCVASFFTLLSRLAGNPRSGIIMFREASAGSKDDRP
jgi:N-acetylglutamate synthase-like GNAT family acetyltransferase